MKRKTVYHNAPKGVGSAIDASVGTSDFLPPPELLVRNDKNVRVTITLSEESIEFFKSQSEHLGVPYQTMIRSVLNAYTRHYANKDRRLKRTAHN